MCFYEENEAIEVSRSIRDISPGSYLLKIKSFSALCESKIGKLESEEFEAGGYKWKLCLYPNGNKDRNRNENGHISLYLAISDAASLPECWEVNVQFKLFVYDHIEDNYLTIQDGRMRRFHPLKTEWGFDQFLSFNTFENPSNGYLFEDSCVFGVEIFVIKNAALRRCSDMQRLTANNTYTWKIKKLSTRKEGPIYSKFTMGELNWKLKVFPKGNPNKNAQGKGISIYLGIAELPKSGRVYAEYKLGIRSQVDPMHSKKRKVSKWFCNLETFGFHQIVTQRALNDKSKGYIVKDSLFVQAEITILGIFKNIN